MTYGNDDFVPVLLGTGVGAYNIARSLHEAYGVSSLAFGRIALRETQHSSIITVRANRDFDDPETIVRTLLDLPSEFPGRKLLLIATIEFYTNVLIDHRSAFDDAFIVPLVDRSLADTLINKTDFYATCASLGVPHPAPTIVTPSHRGDPGIGEDLSFPFPVILKPSNTDIYPRLSFEGKEKVYLVPDAQTLRATVERIFAAGYDDDLIVQEYIEGDETVMRVANTYSDRHGSMRFASVGQVVLADHNPVMVGNNNAILSVRDPELTASLARLLDAVGYIGTANFDVMHDRKDGTSKVLELNLRQGATSYYTMAAGGNIVACFVEDWIHNKPLPLTVTEQERLWLNVPYLVALTHAPRPLRARVRAAAKRGYKHTLWYRQDMSLKRALTVLRVDLRYTLSTFKYAKSGMNR